MKRVKRDTICSLLSVLMLSGCPQGDRLEPPESASVSATPNAICFRVTTSQHYQPVIISIASRGTPEEERWYADKPDLAIANGELCIPFAFYPFTENNEFIVDYVLAPTESVSDRRDNRRVRVGFKIIKGQAYTVPLKPFER